MQHAKRATVRGIRKLGYELRPINHKVGTKPPNPIWDPVAEYTMTDRKRVFALHRAVQYVVRSGVPGDLVECGVYRGGSSMRMALTLIGEGSTDRDLWLYDTFEGMTAPADVDYNLATGEPARTTFELMQTGANSSEWAAADLNSVRSAMESTGYPTERIHYVEGPVEQTLREQPVPDAIAILRLDTDWYASTMAELETLYPRLSPGGALLIDDYDSWAGSRQATDDYFGRMGISLLFVELTGGAVIAQVR